MKTTQNLFSRRRAQSRYLGQGMYKQAAEPKEIYIVANAGQV